MIDSVSSWIGNQQIVTETLEAARSNALSAALASRAPLSAGDPLPWLHHWLYFWTVVAPEELGADGHPAKGGFLPPIPLPRRMWAGGRLRFERPLHISEKATKTSTIVKVEAKSGKTGPLVFVTVEHRISGEGGLAVLEEQDIVYREAAAEGQGRQPQRAEHMATAQWHEHVMPDPVLLFRYSALTMNGHRIHYDRSYATGMEGYPGLVVQGPLQATMLADLAQRHMKSPMRAFAFRGQSPAFDGSELHVCGEENEDGVTLWTQQGGVTTMNATATF